VLLSLCKQTYSLNSTIIFRICAKSYQCFPVFFTIWSCKPAIKHRYLVNQREVHTYPHVTVIRLTITFLMFPVQSFVRACSQWSWKLYVHYSFCTWMGVTCGYVCTSRWFTKYLCLHMKYISNDINVFIVCYLHHCPIGGCVL
jgi:hypothetical protein